MSETTEKKEQNFEEVTEQNVEVNDSVETINEASTANESLDTELKEETLLENEYQSKIAELETKLAEEENRFLRLRADFDNLRRRTQLDREAAEKYRAQSLLSDLLPVIDNFERALQVEVTSEDATSLYKGIEMVYKSLIEATKKEGLELIPAEGEVFDPTIHQAVMQEKDDSKDSGIILRELQKGYKLKDRVIRPSMVSVNE
ncbi:molecular chaperone GrpE [Lysinibacillus composti]|uniref:Protein GrpE n=1 Tax=Lysinibacillus composti TaxID=720633 RepID=A0A3N9UK67_9BACI|nr:nucleotide exchange factor GrpE [Lysinibacillus composti]MBM7607029.1 molecular chaperone GrpE [Lysinibacillus composti]RQW76373.1 nucleotide exchange factor GrpE [Lysinibacillus composti]